MRSTRGAIEAARWIEQRGLDASRTPDWYVEISIPGGAEGARFELNLYPEEWGFVVRTAARVSTIRVTDEPFVHGSDDHRLLSQTPALDRIGDLLHALEQRLGLAFQRTGATVRSNLPRAASVLRAWLSAAYAS